MGIRGLNTIVHNNPTLLKSVELHDKFLVIDGNCISCWLYKGGQPILDGDYSKFEWRVKNFFNKLRQCKIFPIVILEGGHEIRKFQKSMNNMRKKIQKINNIKQLVSADFYPTLITEVFKNTMSDMNIFFCQDILEADAHITKVAQFLDCPVLSFDSDFYLDDVDFIPFPEFQFNKPHLKKNEKASRSGSRYFIEAKLFQRSNFLNSFGGLSELSFLPVLSFLLGNDYSEPTIIQHFFASSLGGHACDLSWRISKLCTWFKNYDSPEIATEKFLEQIPSESRQKTRQNLLRCLDEKNSKEPSYLVQYIQHSLSIISGAAAPPSMLPKIKAIEGSSEWLKNVATYMSSNTAGTAVTTSIPDWILTKHIQGKSPRNLIDLLHTRHFFFPLQMELYSLPSATNHTLTILQYILGILYEEDNIPITVYSRVNYGLDSKIITPIRSISSPILSGIPLLPVSERQKIVFDVLKIKQKKEIIIPDDWKLFFLTLASWYRDDYSDRPKNMTFALGCIIFSSIFVGIIDKKLEYCGTEHSFQSKYSKSWNEINNKRNRQEGNSKSTFTKSGLSTENFTSALENIDNEDCIVALKHFMKFRNIFYSSQKSQCLDKSILHCFGQLQINIQINQILYAVLDLPPNLKIADFYCCTLAYNIYFEIMKHETLESFIVSEFKQMPTLQTLFSSALLVVEKLSNCELPPMKRQASGSLPILVDSKKPKFH